MALQRSVLPLLLLLVTALVSCGEPEKPQQDEAANDLILGERVFTEICLDCHGQATHPAPAIIDSQSWEGRLQQSPDTLVDHAIRGHGQMPPKGGHAELTETEIAAAVAYVVDRARRIIRSKRNLERLSACDRLLDPETCPDAVAGDLWTLHMLYLLNRSSEVP